MAICRSSSSSSSSSSSCVAMGRRLWKLRLLGVLLVALQAVSKSPLGVLSLNAEGLWLMQWKSSLNYTGIKTADPTQSWKATDPTPCKWTGIICTNGSVTSINLNNYGALNGILPQNVFGKLPNLSSLDVGQTNLSGTIPSDLLNSSKLVYLDLGFSYIGGEIPAEISGITSLRHLDLSYAYFNGTVPDSIGSLQELVYLALLSNFFIGPVPDSIGNLTKLQFLTLTGNYFTGTIPPGIFKLQNLTAIDLGDNNFTVAPMPDLSALVNLQYLHFYQCNFSSGPFPEGIRSMSNLSYLALSYCNLTGPIPPWLGNLTNLNTIDLDFNSLTGNIPDIFGSLWNLTGFSVQSNQLTGTIPSSLWDKRGLTTLFLYNNELEGSISPKIGNFLNLSTLDISENLLSGPVPQSIGNLTKLTMFNLFMNNFSGEIPAAVGDWELLQEFRVFSNQLTGTLPYRLGSKCANGLQRVDFSSNNFEGPIPPYLCNGTILTELMLNNNKLNGTIPETYGSCLSLNKFSVYNNMLEGPVPEGLWGGTLIYSFLAHNNQLNGSISPRIANATALKLLRLDNNSFSGPMPAEIGNTSLTKFRAHFNNFSGAIPSQLGNLANLNELFLGSNSFTGAVPPALGKLTQLTQLDLSRNHLTGSIPDLKNLSMLNTLDVSNNNLTGTIPSDFYSMFNLQNLDVAYNNLSGIIPDTSGSNSATVNFTGNPYLCRENACNSSIVSSPSTGSSKRSKKIETVIGVVFGAAALILLVGTYLFVRRYKTVLDAMVHGSKGDENSWILTSFQKKAFQEYEITDLDEDNVIGSGGSGKVYKATLENGDTVAIKKLWTVKKGGSSRSSDHGFSAEVNTLGNIRHRHIVKLLCCCSKKDSNLLVYEYMENGSLGDLLHSTKKNTLTWDMRYNIALGAAMGLEYLHHDCTPQILHRDVKTNNILLDVTYEAHLADFGIAKIIESTGSHDSTTVAGSLGYMAPEYAYRMRVDEKGDIYSFGVVLLELVTGRPAIDSAVFGEGVDLVSWVSTKVQTKEGLHEILDPDCGKSVQDEMIMLLRVGLLCTSFMPMSRPSMREVVMMLKIAEPKSIRDAKAKVGDAKVGDEKAEGTFLDKVEVSVQK